MDSQLSLLNRQLELDPLNDSIKANLLALKARVLEPKIQELFSPKGSFCFSGIEKVQLNQELEVVIHTCRPGLLIGRRGSTIEALKRHLSLIDSDILIKIEENFHCEQCLLGLPHNGLRFNPKQFKSSTIWPGHPITISFAAVNYFDNYQEAVDNMLKCHMVPGAGGQVISAKELLRYLNRSIQPNNWHLSYEEAMMFADEGWDSCDDQKIKHPNRWRKGQDQANSIKTRLKKLLIDKWQFYWL